MPSAPPPPYPASRPCICVFVRQLYSWLESWQLALSYGLPNIDSKYEIYFEFRCPIHKKIQNNKVKIFGKVRLKLVDC